MLEHEAMEVTIAIRLPTVVKAVDDKDNRVVVARPTMV